ncbi:MAG: hypothetical protein KBB77_02335 [Candidatus Moranbacteria bacterium]|nr:hypothetical protein [Candidatus Moranbacteria bacterium]
MDTVTMILALVLSPLFVYANFWWFPIIFVGGILSGVFFKKDNLNMLSPFIMLEIISGNQNRNRLIGVVFSLTSFALSFYVFFPETGYGIWFYYFIFLGMSMFVGVIASYFRK